MSAADQNNTRTSERSQRGFNLIEIAIVLAVIGVIVGGIYVAASSVYESNKKQKTLAGMLSLVQNIRSAYAGQASFGATALTTANLITARMVPADMVSGTNAMVSPYGAVTFTGAASATTFTLAYAGLSAAGCTDIATKLAGSDTAMNSFGITTITIGGTAYTTAPAVPTIISRCSGGNATITPTFNLRS